MRVDREIIAVRIALSTLFNIVNDFTKNTESFNCGWANCIIKKAIKRKS